MEGETESPLTLSLTHGRPDTAQLLLDLGADKTTFQRMTSPQKMRTIVTRGSDIIFRMFYIAGVDLSASCADVDGETFEEKALRRVERYRGLGAAYDSLVERYAKIVELIEGVRLAGSYREFVLQDYKQLLRIRSLLARGRATMAPETPEVIQRLFGGTVAASRGSPKRPRPPPERFAGIPYPIFWKVLEFYRLGDWRRPSTLPP